LYFSFLAPSPGDAGGYLFHDPPVRLLDGVELKRGFSISTATALLTYSMCPPPIKTLMN